MKSIFSIAAVAAVSFAVVACGGNVCDDAADVLTGCTSATADADTSSAEVKCEGSVEKVSQCVVDNKDAACQKGDDAAKKKYADCIVEASK